MIRRSICAALAIGAATAFISVANAQHITDGAFTSGAEWTNGRPTVASGAFGFNPVTNRGGAVLYVEQSSAGGQGGLNKLGDVLSLMYDYASSPTALPGTDNTNGSIDVFFEVPDDDDYAIHITGSGFLAFEVAHGTPSPENPDGSLHFMNPDGSAFGPWSLVATNELSAFHALLGFGPSPNNPVPHLIAEFDVTIENPANPGGGVYSPDPAFWSAGGKHGQADPPISSEIFQLRPDGFTDTIKMLNEFGDPVAHPQDLPEPTTLLSGSAMAGLLMMRKRRK